MQPQNTVSKRIICGKLKVGRRVDLSLSATAIEDGDAFVFNGEKNFVTRFDLADYCIVVARTKKPGEVQKRHQGISLFIVPTNLPGIEFCKYKKKGMHSTSLCQVFFTDARVPKEEPLGLEPSPLAEPARWGGHSHWPAVKHLTA